MQAGKRGFDDIMRLLLQQPGDLKPDCRDGAALVAASLEGQEHVVRTLLEWPENAPKAYCQNYQVLCEVWVGGSATQVTVQGLDKELALGKYDEQRFISPCYCAEA